MASLEKLKAHLREAYTVIDERNLYTIWEYIPKGSDPDFQGNSFNEGIRQGWEPKVYVEWADKIEDLFFANNLDYLKFKRVTSSFDPRKASSQPAALFVRKVKELERILENPAVFESYKTKEKQAAAWPHVTFRDGKVTQGSRTHTFSQPIYNKLLKTLWPNRRIETPTGTVLTEGKPIPRDKLNKIVGINGHRRFIDISTGIRKAMRIKSIGLNVMYPDDVILVVKQSRK